MTDPTETKPAADTFARSCAHWSEDGRAGMDSFYVLATEDYRQLATAFDWGAWLATRETAAGDRALRLLDVACGSGKFPAALRVHSDITTTRLRPIAYDLLDPSAFSLREARATLEHPFVPDREFHCRLQDLDGAALAYDVVWAVHALYALPGEEIADGLARFVDALAEDGVAFIANACEDSHYLGFYRAYLEGCRGGQGTPYTSAEAIVSALQRLGVGLETRVIEYEGQATHEQERDVEGYLQRCLFDDTLSLDEMLREPALGAYLRRCRRDEGWRFRQRVMLIFVSR